MMRRVYSFLALFAALIGLTAMPVMAQDSRTVVDVLVGDDEGRFTTLTGAVAAAGLANALASGGPFTVFAPTNEAFAAALASLGDEGAALASNPEVLAQVLLYHVVPGRVTAATLSFGRSTQPTLLEGAALAVVGGRQGVTINGSANVIQADIPASNGIIHVIDAVLLPPTIMDMLAGGAESEPAVRGQPEIRPNIPAVLNNDPEQRFTTLISALTTARLTDALDAEGQFTLLAPTNDAFNASLEALGLSVSQVAADPALLSQVLLYHVIPERTRTTNLFGGATLTTLQGEEVTFAENERGQLTVNGVVVRQGNIQAGNGVIHVLDGVLIPPTILAALTAPPAPEVVAPQARPNLVDTLAADEEGRFTMLVTAIDLAELRPLLNSSSPYTIFAPTDAAISASLQALGLTVGDLVGDLDMLREILLYHVVPGRVRSTELFRGVTLRTLSGQDLVTAEDERGRLTAGGVIVGQSNIAAGNGFIHVLNDSILIPPSLAAALAPPAEEQTPTAQAAPRPTVAEILAADEEGRFTTLLAAVEAAGLTETLTSAGNFTVLAPTNAAFEAALAETGLTAAELLADTETLTAILTYHVLPVRTRTALLLVGAELTTLNGERVRFSALARGQAQLVINGGAARVLDGDKVGSNGVVHVIDAVLVPRAVAEALAANRGQIRVAHFSPDAGPVDIYINGALSALQGVTFGAVSDWIDVPARVYSIAVAPAGQYPIGVASYQLQPGSRVTIAAIGAVTRGTLNVQFIEEDYSPLPAGAARVTIFHAVEGVGVVDVRFNGTTVVAGLGYPGSLGENDGADIVTVSGSTYTIDAVVSGVGTVIAQTQFPLSAGNYYLLALVGTPDRPRFVLRTVTP